MQPTHHGLRKTADGGILHPNTKLGRPRAAETLHHILTMPARSNILQRLVLEIHKGLGPEWNVAESRFFDDADTGKPREVDVVAESSFGGYPITISVEVRDRGRPADVRWVEEMVQKHKALPTTKLVLWSSAGFTDTALLKAKSLKAEALHPTDGAAIPWAKFAQDIANGFLKLVNVKFDTVIDVCLEDGTLARWPANSETTLTAEDGAVTARIGAILSDAMPHLRTALLDHAKDGDGDFFAVYEPPVSCTVLGPDSMPGRVQGVIFSMATQTGTAPLETRSVLRSDTVTTIAEAQFREGDIRIVAREAEGRPVVTSAIRVPAKGTPRR